MYMINGHLTIAYLCMYICQCHTGRWFYYVHRIGLIQPLLYRYSGFWTMAYCTLQGKK